MISLFSRNLSVVPYESPAAPPWLGLSLAADPAMNRWATMIRPTGSFRDEFAAVVNRAVVHE